ncbi:uncharacterized protein LOC114798223 [Denticeps clupeoides]|uniref:Uncharacterized protein n=1 Tax=Denticeps clupeoides TaxID=299321 RepID=A0AAY4ECA9_9TELE|nr:myoD family inhibitor domain-containing protein 2 [Denticeps clupeoides]
MPRVCKAVMRRRPRFSLMGDELGTRMSPCGVGGRLILNVIITFLLRDGARPRWEGSCPRIQAVPTPTAAAADVLSQRKLIMIPMASLSGTERPGDGGEEEEFGLHGTAPQRAAAGRRGEAVVCGVRRLSTISEKDAGSLGGSEWAGSRASLCSSDNHFSRSNFASTESHLSDSRDDCASVLLACLYCNFYNIVVMLPGMCERSVIRCCPSYKYYQVSGEKTQVDDCCNCNLTLDCSLCNSCQEAGELLELAMEISEVCYR